MDGSVDLINKSQNMRVLVLPELNAGLASLGYVLVNPAVGLGSFIAQYILRDPLRKILAYEYKSPAHGLTQQLKRLLKVLNL